MKAESGAEKTGAPRPAVVTVPNGVKRGAFDRMKKIFGLFQDGKYRNCTSISTDFEVLLERAGRDIEFMRERWNLPIDYDDKRHGFFFTEKVERLPWVPVTEAELFAVCILHPPGNRQHRSPESVIT